MSESEETGRGGDKKEGRNGKCISEGHKNLNCQCLHWRRRDEELARRKAEMVSVYLRIIRI